MDNIWQQSVELDFEAARSKGCITLLPIRIHSRNELADEANRQVVKDWGDFIGDGWEKKVGWRSGFSPAGNWGAFIFPESLPERLGVATYLADLGCIHDDICEELDYDEAVYEHRQLSSAIDTHGSLESSRVVTASARAMNMKKCMAKCLLAAIELDRTRAVKMLDCYRSKWLDVSERDRQTMSEIETLEDYYYHRALNGGMEPYWMLVQFSMAIDISSEQQAQIAPIFAAADAALLLTNDYWSWEREWHDAQRTSNPRIFNAIYLLMRTKGMAMDAAKIAVLELIHRHEKEYLRRRDEFYTSNPDLPLYLRRYIEVAGAVVSGNSLWCATCPRHNAWRSDSLEAHQPTQVQMLDTIADGMCHETQRDEVMAAAVEEIHGGHNGDTNTCPTFSEGGKTSMSSDSARASSLELWTRTHTLSASDGSAITPPLPTSPAATSGEEELQHQVTKRRSPPRPLYAPCEYISSMPSKGVRNSIIAALNQWLTVEDTTTQSITEIISLLHNSSLILDDIEDGSPLRRGLPATHTVFGQAQSINSANFMFVQAVQLAHRLPRNTESTQVLLDELHCLFQGQSWDLYWNYNMKLPGCEEDYINMIDLKTGSMFRLLTRLMALNSPLGRLLEASDKRISDRLYNLSVPLGRFFQIRDDFMNLHSGTYTDQKGFCEDFDEGKISYPVLRLLLHHRPELQDQVLGIFRQNTMSKAISPGGRATSLPRETKAYLKSLLEKSGSVRDTLDKLKELERETYLAIQVIEDEIGSNPVLRLLVARLSVKDMSL